MRSSPYLVETAETHPQLPQHHNPLTEFADLTLSKMISFETTMLLMEKVTRTRRMEVQRLLNAELMDAPYAIRLPPPRALNAPNRSASYGNSSAYRTS
jgi:hypothetical protein